MFILFASKIKAENVLVVIAKVFCFFLLPFGIFCSGYIGWISLFATSGIPAQKEILSGYTFPLEKIGQGALSLDRGIEKPMLKALTSEIVLLAKNRRPREEGSSADFLFSLKSQVGERQAKSGEVLFLRQDLSAKLDSAAYFFSDEKTSFWILPSLFDGDKVRLEICLDEGSPLEERAQIIVQEDRDFQYGEQDVCFLQELESAKLWGQDLLLARFGGEMYASLKDKVKVEIPGKKRTVFCFLGKGDFLWWDKKEGWTPLADINQAVGSPISQVKNVTSKMIELEVWGASGFSSYSLQLDLQKAGFKTGEVSGFSGKSTKAKGEDLPHLVQLRSPKQVSCSLGKKRYFLREGDWVLKTSRGWKNLKTAADLDSYLRHVMRGELFIFDCLVEESGKLFMKGFLVDEMRTSMAPISLPVAGKSREQLPKKAEKRRPSFIKDERSFITYFPDSVKEQGIDQRDKGDFDE